MLENPNSYLLEGVFHDGSIKVNEHTQILIGAGLFSHIWVVQGCSREKCAIGPDIGIYMY